MNRIKVGQIGICHEHAKGKMQTLRSLPDVFDIVGVVDDRATTAPRFAGDDLEPYEGLAWMGEAELLAVPGLQAVLIETPNADLVPTALRCVERGLAMHLDKPGGEDLALFGQLLDACEARDVPLQMGYMFRTNPAMLFTKEVIGKGWLGDVFEIRGNMSHNYGGDPYQHYLSRFRGGIMFNLGCHLIDWAVSVMGRPESVTPFLKAAPDSPADVLNNGLAILEYANAYVSVNACSREVDGLNFRRLNICGTKGTVELSPLERFDASPLNVRLSLLESNGEYDAGTHRIDCGVQHDRYADQLLELASIVNGEIDNPSTYEHDRLVQEVVLAAAGYRQWGT